MINKKVRHVPLKIIGLLVLLLVIGLLARGFYLDTKEDYSSAGEAMTKRYVQTSIDSIDHFLLDHEKALKALAQNDHIQNIEESSVTKEESIKALETLLKSDDQILNVYMGTETGNMYLYPPATLPDWFIAKDRPWYISALEGPSIFWTEPYVDVATSQIVISNALKVENNGRLIGVVASDLSLENLFNTLKENPDSEPRDLIIISSTKRYLFHPNDGLIGLEVLDQGLLDQITDQSGYFEYTPFENMKPIFEEASPLERETYKNLESQSPRQAYYQKNILGWTLIGQDK